MQKSQSFKHQDVEIIGKETLYKGFFSLVGYQLRHKLYAGGWSPEFKREIFERGHAVGVILFDPHADKVILVEQFRPGAMGFGETPWLLEFVAGMIEPGQSETEVARREAEEESGMHLGRIEFVLRYLTSPGGTTESIAMYVAEVDSSEAGGVHGLAHEHEDIRVVCLSRDELFEKLDAGQLTNGLTLIGAQWLKLEGESLRKRWLEP